MKIFNLAVGKKHKVEQSTLFAAPRGDYGPASLVHEWEFDLHHANRSDKWFEEVRDTMMEAVSASEAVSSL